MELRLKGLSVIGSTVVDSNYEDAGGEGTRGGKVIGHTSSGKPIYETFDKGRHRELHKAFSVEEHKKTADWHQGKALDAELGGERGQQKDHLRLHKMHKESANRKQGVLKRSPRSKFHGM